ncbi:MAG: hypothetical protein RBR16_06625 [Syntrophus sp. (in: bacteria)]|nr:hypothetical protein [Syntrophus sp. (in: bacteria)]
MLLIPEPASPGMELVTIDLFFLAKGGDIHTACCLVLDDGVPIYSSFLFGRHSLPLNKEFRSSLWEAIAQGMTDVKMGTSDAYVALSFPLMFATRRTSVF